MTKNEFSQVKNIISRLRADVLYNLELVLTDQPEKYRLVRKKILDLFGMAWGAEAQLRNICSDNGQARLREVCGKEASHE